MSQACKKKYLVIDDEAGNTLLSQKDFVNDINQPNYTADFVTNCEDALKVLAQDPSYLFCFVDCKIPLNDSGLKRYNPDRGDSNGLDLIQQIISLNEQIAIIVFSAYVNRSQIIDKIDYRNVVGCISKKDSKAVFQKAVDRLMLLIESSEAFDLETKSPTIQDTNDSSVFYNTLDTDTKAFVLQKSKQISYLIKRSTQDILDIGLYLTQVKEKLDHGKFDIWAKSELQWSKVTAGRFMRAYNKFKEFNLNQVELLPSVMYELSKKQVPQEAIAEAVDLARAGKTITVEFAKSIKDKHIKEIEAEKYDDSLDEVESGVVNNSANKNSSNGNPENTLDRKPIQKSIFDIQQTSSRQTIVKHIPRQNQWQIGRHSIICCEPNSGKFKSLLPNKIALVLDFSHQDYWNCTDLQYDSINIFQSKHTDIDESGLLSLVQNAIEIATEEGEIVAVSYIPSPKILLLLDRLGCVAFIADSDFDKCLELVRASQNIVYPE